ncbi:MAG: PAS domain S-box protein [Candidatus Heimdallarchaeota archaeon]|nr:PAS domain S-box protein [Candidatus Heimdallarchaeota archaeon]
MNNSVNKKTEIDKIDSFYRILCENANDSITLFKLNEFNEIQNFVYTNAATTKWTGFTKEEILNSSPKDLFTEDQLESISKNIETIVKEGFLTYESEIRIKDGRTLPVEFSSSLIDLDGEKYILTSGREIAERVETRIEREENMKEKTLLLDILTHDLRNYIAVLWGWVTESIEQEDITKEDILSSVGRAKTSLTKTDALLDDISVLMKKDLEFTYELKSVNVLNNVNKCKPNLDDMFPVKKIKLNIKDINSEHNVFADMLFEQLLFNILTNSVKNTSKKEVIIDIITEEKPGNKILISIADYGKGITPDTRRNIFDRYGEFRKKGKGSGLGLFIVQTLVQRYNGDVWLENRIKGDYTQGTVVKIELRKADTQIFEFA